MGSLYLSNINRFLTFLENNMSTQVKHSIIQASEIESAAAAAVERAVAARGQAGIELSQEQLNSVSGGAGYYFRDGFIYGILVNPLWFNKFNIAALNPQPLPPGEINLKGMIR